MPQHTGVRPYLPTFTQATATDFLFSEPGLRLPTYKASYLARYHPYIRYTPHYRHFMLQKEAAPPAYGDNENALTATNRPRRYVEPITPERAEQIRASVCLFFDSLATVVPAVDAAYHESSNEMNDATGEDSMDTGSV